MCQPLHLSIKMEVLLQSIHALAPTLTTVMKLTGAFEDTPFSISYATLAAAADENDSDGDAISFVLSALSSGSLTAADGSVVSAGQSLSAGETWTWQADEHANGDLDAFTVEAAKRRNSGTPVQVIVEVTSINDAPTAAAATYQAVAGSSLSSSYRGTDPDHAEAELLMKSLSEPSQGVYNFSAWASVSHAQRHHRDRHARLSSRRPTWRAIRKRDHHNQRYNVELKSVCV